MLCDRYWSIAMASQPPTTPGLVLVDDPPTATHGTAEPLSDLQDAREAFERVKAEIMAVLPPQLAPMNVSIPKATSTVLGVAPRILALREQAARLPDFDLRCVDRLSDYAKATWLLHATDLPPPGAEQFEPLEREARALRARLLSWAAPLAMEGILAQAALEQIRKGAGARDVSSDLVALVAIYRAAWDNVRHLCGVTEHELERAAVVGTALFAHVSRLNTKPAVLPETALRVRQAWTLLDLAYSQCRRAVAYLRHAQGDADTFAPGLRGKTGPRRKRAKPEQAAETPDATSPRPTTTASSPVPGPPGPIGEPKGG